MHLGFILSLITLSACAGQSPRLSTEILDEQTGNTLLIVTKPLVFARPRIDVAAHARDYATVVAVEIDHSGKDAEYVLLYRWSTVDRRMSAPPDAQAGELRILADGRPIDLLPLQQIPVGLTRRRALHLPEHGDVIAHAYAIDVNILRFIATSRELTVHMPQEKFDASFALWEDGRKALGQFVQQAAAP